MFIFSFQVMNQLHDKIVALDNLTDLQKAAICERIAVSDELLSPINDKNTNSERIAIRFYFLIQIFHRDKD